MDHLKELLVGIIFLITATVSAIIYANSSEIRYLLFFFSLMFGVFGAALSVTSLFSINSEVIGKAITDSNQIDFQNDTFKIMSIYRRMVYFISIKDNRIYALPLKSFSGYSKPAKYIGKNCEIFTSGEEFHLKILEA